ncbi:MAG: DinB family protein [Candidatus Doudnabacteria bacterium]
MTNKEFFLKVLDAERPVFRAVIDALPEDKHAHKVHERSRAAGNLAAQLAVQWMGISDIVKTGSPGMEHFKGQPSKSKMLTMFDEGMDELKKDVKAISDEKWENDEANMGQMWKTKKYDMAWGFLFDAIHHRGQLTTFLRQMGEKVPMIYGPSADVQMEK